MAGLLLRMFRCAAPRPYLTFKLWFSLPDLAPDSYHPDLGQTLNFSLNKCTHSVFVARWNAVTENLKRPMPMWEGRWNTFSCCYQNVEEEFECF